MENATISKKSLETLTREILSIWECDYMDITDGHNRKIATALDEAIAVLDLQPELDEKARQQREEQWKIWKERQAKEQKAKESEAN